MQNVDKNIMKNFSCLILSCYFFILNGPQQHKSLDVKGGGLQLFEVHVFKIKWSKVHCKKLGWSPIREISKAGDI